MTRPYGSDPYRRGSPMSRGFLPLALITIGVVFLLSNLVPERGRGGLVILALGAAFVIGRLTTGRYGYAVPAGILLAIGTYAILHDMAAVGGMAGSGLFFLLLGLGFALAYVIGMRPFAYWPLFPAIILTGIGLVMLGVSALGPLASLSWIVGYWPIALVLLGAWLLLRDSLPEPARRPIATLGGLALLAYGVLAAVASVAAASPSARPDVGPWPGSPPFGRTYAVEESIAPDGTFTVDNPSGHTTIRAGSGSTVHVEVARRFSMGGGVPDVRLTPTDNGLTLQSSVSRGRWPFGDSGAMDYTIEVPASVTVIVTANSGSIDIDGVSGPLRVSTRSGSIHATGLQHLQEAQSTSGSISLDGVFTDAARITATSGSVHVKLEPGSAEQLNVHTNSGSIHPEGNIHLLGGETNRTNLTGAYGNPSPGATLNIQTTSGSISISQ